jgi:hypothetical protein
MKSCRLLPLAPVMLLLFSINCFAQAWTTKLDKDVRFYLPTDLGVLVAGTEKSLYAIDAANGATLWRRKDVSLDETDVAPVPATELLLLSLEKGDKARIEAVNLLTGESIWRSDKVKGSVMHIAVDPEANLLAVVLAKDAKSRAREGFKRHPLLHVLDLGSGEELWHYEVGEVEMMPARWPDDAGKEVDYSLDNYYPPVFVDGRLYVFYEGLTSFDARNGKARLREKYRVNEDGLALTEAEPIFANSYIYVSGHGRASDRARDGRHRVGSKGPWSHAGDGARRRCAVRAHGWSVHPTERRRDNRAWAIRRERDQRGERESALALQGRRQRHHQSADSWTEYSRDCRSRRPDLYRCSNR